MTVSTWWGLWAFLAGAYGGFFLFALLGMGRAEGDDNRERAKLAQARRQAFSQPGGPSTVI